MKQDLIKIVLVEPRIPPNTGNVARLCAANDIELHLVGKLGFSLDDKSLKRAGLDYWEHVKLFLHDDLDAFIAKHAGPNIYFFTKKASKDLFDVNFKKGDVLVFGPEDNGFCDEILNEHHDELVRVPMLTNNVRSLNLSSTVAVAAYEALRQITNKRLC